VDIKLVYCFLLMFCVSAGIMIMSNEDVKVVKLVSGRLLVSLLYLVPSPSLGWMVGFTLFPSFLFCCCCYFGREWTVEMCWELLFLLIFFIGIKQGSGHSPVDGTDYSKENQALSKEVMELASLSSSLLSFYPWASNFDPLTNLIVPLFW